MVIFRVSVGIFRSITTDTPISSVIDSATMLLEHQFKTSSCSLEFKKQEKLLVNGDPGKLNQVVTNILINGLEAYEGKTGKVEISTYKDSNNAVIMIKDYAKGISDTFKESIFKEILTTKGTKGTGLGLYISNSIITGHFNGSLTFDSEIGKGTTFYISIPILNN